MQSLYIYVPSSTDGVWLYDGQKWNLVSYLGPTLPCEDATKSIAAYLVRIWYYDNASGIWYMYDPADPWGSDLLQLVNGRAYHIKVTQDCYWRWETAEVSYGFDIGQPVARAA
jgi:hypothetical protein